MNTDKNTFARSMSALPYGRLLNAALLRAVLVSAAFLSIALLSVLFLGGCSNPLGGEISESGGGNVTLTFGKSDGRAITSGVDLPADVLASMRFESKLTGPNREALTLNAKWGETAKLKLRQGKWRIDAKAYQADSPNLAGTGSISFEIQAKNNKIIVPMAMRDTAGAPLSCYEIHVPGFANGQVEASFTAAYPGTTVTLTTAPTGGYILHSLTYTDGTTTHTPSGGGNEYAFTMPDADVTVSAAFTSFYTVKYSAGTGIGTVPEPAAVGLGSSIILPAGSAPSGGIPFYSWEVDGTAYPAGASYTVTGDVTLTARWAFSSVSGITAYLDGMTGGMSAADPLPLPAGIAFVDTAWDALLGEILLSGKYVAMDLSISTISGVPAEFNPASSSSPAKSQIVSLVLPDTPFSIADGSSSNPTFNGFGSLKKVSGAGVTGIGQYAFSSTSIAEVSFPAAVDIGERAFNSCDSLAEVSLPAVTTLGDYVFNGCTALVTVYFPAAVSIGTQAFHLCDSLAEVSLPKVTSIGDYAFFLCTSLDTVNLPVVMALGDYAFGMNAGGSALTITLGSTPPPVTGTNMFMGVSFHNDVTVKVPSTALDLGLYDTAWQDDFIGGGTNPLYITLSVLPL
ncbi:MAG: leucine-rich repeat domain-containing protein [Treponema sp.]|jgi:hypothetical protein|nr:leucine-rich repeat domain-containing protein [Treponema sp.]